MTALAGFGVDQEATGPPSSAGRWRSAGCSVAPRRRVLAPRRREAGGVVGHDGPLVMPGPAGPRCRRRSGARRPSRCLRRAGAGRAGRRDRRSGRSARWPNVRSEGRAECCSKARVCSPSRQLGCRRSATRARAEMGSKSRWLPGGSAPALRAGRCQRVGESNSMSQVGPGDRARRASPVTRVLLSASARAT